MTDQELNEIYLHAYRVAPNRGGLQGKGTKHGDALQAVASAVLSSARAEAAAPNVRSWLQWDGKITIENDCIINGVPVKAGVYRCQRQE